MQFRTRIAQTGTNTTGIEVPSEVLESLNAGKRPPVSVTVNDYRYRTTIGTVDGRPMISVSSAVREAAGVGGGDEVTVAIELDTGPREVTVPPDLERALAMEPLLKQLFDSLSRSKKQRLTLPIENAKTEATKERNVHKALAALRETLDSETGV